MIKNIDLSEAVHKAIAEVKVKEIEELEKNKKQLIARIDEYIENLKKSEEMMAAFKVELDDMKTNFSIEQTKMERKLASAEALASNTEQREKHALDKCEKLNEQLSMARQELAATRKEVDMLREHRDNKQTK